MVGLKSYYLRSPVYLLTPSPKRPAHNGRPLSPARYLSAAEGPRHLSGAQEQVVTPPPLLNFRGRIYLHAADTAQVLAFFPFCL